MAVALEAVSRALAHQGPPPNLVKLSLYKRPQSPDGSLVAFSPFQKQCGGLRGCPCTVLQPVPAIRAGGIS